MPPLYEGDLLYMPHHFSRHLAYQSPAGPPADRQDDPDLPGSASRFRQNCRAETATDPAPFDMIETTIMLKPEEEWPAVDLRDDAGKIIAHRRRTPDELEDAMDAAVRIPGLNNAWTMPIKTRIDYAGNRHQKPPLASRSRGPTWRNWSESPPRSRRWSRRCPAPRVHLPSAPWVATMFNSTLIATPSARYGLTVGDVQDVLEVALGGMPLTTTVEGLERYASISATAAISAKISSPSRDHRAHIPPAPRSPLGQLATNPNRPCPYGRQKAKPAVPNAWIYVDVKGVDIELTFKWQCAPSTRPVGQRLDQTAQRLQHLLERPI